MPQQFWSNHKHCASSLRKLQVALSQTLLLLVMFNKQTADATMNTDYRAVIGLIIKSPLKGICETLE